MGHLDHAAFGWLTPVLSYAMAAIGAALGLRCTVRALGSRGRSRRNWLITAASALGTGIWTMHFVAMLGFGVTGTDIRYDVPLTLLSLLVAMLVVGAGVFTVGYGKDRPRALVVGGLTTGLGVASMHYLGMAALRLHGSVAYDPLLVTASVGIAVAAATAALWAALNIRSAGAVALASLVTAHRVPGRGEAGAHGAHPAPEPLAQRFRRTPGHRNRWAGHGCGETRGHRDAERLHAVRRRRHRGSRCLRIADGNSGGRDRIEDTCPARTGPQRRDAGA
ncbi:MHYT domain-containing protein [[Kitasatospora] papulosa]|uniref:MHYT domain-containing protein n=1 Tax=[Kitasatospora] papulosa TaxID=1464011 RepID=UPI00367AAF25